MESKSRSGHWIFRLGVAVPFLLVGGGLLWVWLTSSPSLDTSLEPVSVLALAGSEGAAALSPDGGRVAYSWSEPGQGNFDLYVRRIETGDSLRLTESAENELFPAWSPDGSMIAFILEAAEKGCGIYRIPAIGGPQEKVGDCFGEAFDLIWSPDGNLLAFSDVGEGGEVRRIYAVNLQSRQRRPLTEPPADSQGDRYPAFAPDGRQLALQRTARAGQQDIFVQSMQSGRLKRVTYDKGARIRGLDWTAEGREIIFASDRGGRFSLWKVAAEGGAVGRFPIHAHWITQPRSARGMNRLIYKRTIDVTDLWSLRLDEQGTVLGDPQRLAASTRTELHPQLSPDGLRLAFTSNRTGAWEVWTSNLDGSDQQQISQMQGALVSSPRWSADGRLMIFDAFRQGHGDLYLVAGGSRTPRRLTLEASDEINASFSRDGLWIYFASNRRNGWQIWKMPASGGPAMRVTRRGGFLAQEGREGKYLYYSKLEQAGLWRLTLQGGEEERIIDALSPSDWGNWAVRRRGIYFVQREPLAVAFFNFDDGLIRPVFQPQGPIPSFNPILEVSESEDLLICGLIQQSEEEVMLVDF